MADLIELARRKLADQAAYLVNKAKMPALLADSIDSIEPKRTCLRRATSECLPWCLGSGGWPSRSATRLL